MPYEESIVKRVRAGLAKQDSGVKVKMMGSLVFMVNTGIKFFNTLTAK